MRRVMLFGSLFAFAGSAHADDTPLYQPAPAWVEGADLASASSRTKGPVVVYDVQQLIEGDRVTAYVDQALRIERPEALSQFGTLNALWMPDKGDLIIHRAELYRGGEVIDLLKDHKFEVLRREQQLEQRTLTGILTATLLVPGARVNDTVRLSYSVTTRDSALKGQVQRVDFLPFGPLQVGLGRFRASWPKDRKVAVSVRPGLTAPKVIDIGNLHRIEIELPLAKPAEMPTDAPPRFLLPPQFSLTSFASWPELSRTMEPLFETTGKVAADSPIAEEVGRIRSAGGSPRVQAAAALKIVQDRIGYFANGMNGGNYVPQSPAETWHSRYGDCKAKTLLLLAMLRDLGIQARPMLVRSQGGDAVGDSLPMPAAFDHIVVLAEIEGQALILDGTSLGASPESLGDAPNFKFGLPLTKEGADLLRLPARALQVPQIVVTASFDQSFGVDFPQIVEARIEQRGPLAAMAKPIMNLAEGEERNELIDTLAALSLGEIQVIERKMSIDEASGAVVAEFKGFQNSRWDRDQRRAVLGPTNLTTSIDFAPDRGRTTWQQVPVDLGTNGRVKRYYSFILPQGGAGFELQGGTFKGEVVGLQIDRTATLADGRLVIAEETASQGGELPAADIAAERAKAEALKGAAWRVRAPTDVPRRWDLRTPAELARLKPLVELYDRQIAAQPDKAEFWTARASFFKGISEHAKAKRDLDQAIKLDGNANYYAERGDLAIVTGQFAAAVSDLAKAWELDPTPERLVALTMALGQNGQAQLGLEKIESALDSAGDSKPALLQVRAELLARVGRKSEGLAELDSLLEERPGDGVILNARCWYRGAWNFALEQVRSDCDSAVQSSDFSPPVLDSRAMAFLRLGELDKALADADAALARAGWLTQTLLLRGVIRTRKGNPAGAADIAEALRRSPGLKQEYAGYGLLP